MSARANVNSTRQIIWLAASAIVAIVAITFLQVWWVSQIQPRLFAVVGGGRFFVDTSFTDELPLVAVGGVISFGISVVACLRFNYRSGTFLDIATWPGPVAALVAYAGFWALMSGPFVVILMVPGIAYTTLAWFLNSAVIIVARG